MLHAATVDSEATLTLFEAIVKILHTSESPMLLPI